MRHALYTLAFALLSSAPAHAQTSRQAGPYSDFAVGSSFDGYAPHVYLAGRASFGVWWGNYDQDYLLGRSWGLGASLLAELHGQELRYSPRLDVRRSLDLLVVGLRGRASVGPTWVGPNLGGAVSFGAGFKWRPTPTVGPILELDAGLASDMRRLDPRIGILIGLEGAGPAWRRARKDP